MLCTDCLSVLGQPKVNPLPILSKGGRAGQNQYHYKLRHRHTRNIQALLALEASTLRAHSPHFINSMLTKQAKTIMAGGATNSTYIGHGVCFLHVAANNKAWSTSRSSPRDADRCIHKLHSSLQDKGERRHLPRHSIREGGYK